MSNLENDRLIEKVLRKSKYEKDLEMLCKYWPDYICEDCHEHYPKIQPPYYGSCYFCGGSLIRLEKSGEKEEATV